LVSRPIALYSFDGTFSLLSSLLFSSLLFSLFSESVALGLHLLLLLYRLLPPPPNLNILAGGRGNSNVSNGAGGYAPIISGASSKFI